ncbi:MAG TPA: hypothetical protein VLB44_12625 [Kofleriaceae bacterium]|nr:hypothetical protein [Kofleriaceae bacterium]
MKTILVAVVGTVGLLATPAVAGSPKKQPEPKKAEVTKPVAEASLGEAGVSKAIAEVAPSSPEALGIPDLPPDTTSLFSQVSLPAPVLAGKPMARATKDKAPVMKLGNDYVLGGKRKSAKPTEEVQQIVPKGLSRTQVSTYIDTHAGDIQLCWDKIPAKQRAEACTASLQLSIADAGNVTDIEIGGDVPAAAHACIVHVVSHWQFPVAETSTETEYGISLRSR